MVAPGPSLGIEHERISSPGRGERTTWRAGPSFQQVLSPLRGFGTLFRQPQACAWGYNLPPLWGYSLNSGLACEAWTGSLFGTIPPVRAPASPEARKMKMMLGTR
jgi:hypothetical protein